MDPRHPASLIRRSALALATLVAASLAFAASASATTETFNYTGAAQTWTVPAGVTSASFDLYGAQGGRNTELGVNGGFGGRATATINVTPGASIQVNVGGAGARSSVATVGPQGGFNGGGNCVTSLCSSGGGASDVRIGGTTLHDRKLVAGGGGGNGPFSCGGIAPTGGDGGGLTGGGGVAATGGACGNSVAGGGGTQSAGGAGGGLEAPGTFGEGSSGFQGSAGGGGWYGGGAGSAVLAGGGGGSGYGPAGTAFQTGVRSGDGLVTVTYTEPVTIADLIDSVNALNLAKGTKTSLLQKLNGAQKNLGSGNTGGACDKLASFISQVKAVRSKKIIPASAADELIADARAVRASIGC